MSDFGDFIIEEHFRERDKKYRSLYSFLLKQRDTEVRELLNIFREVLKSNEVVNSAPTLDLILCFSLLLGSLLHSVSVSSDSKVDPVYLAEETLKFVCCLLSDNIKFRDSIADIIKSEDFDE